MEPGERIGVIATVVFGKCEFLGYGKYVGEAKINERPTKELLLDSGETMYAFEAWWDKEDKIREALARYELIVELPLSEWRARQRV